MNSYVDASVLVNNMANLDDEPMDYPTPDFSTITDPEPELERPQKKKRKAWGQPVPEITPILPPRKRAKTAEEKEQRKNERILRNRRAADKSRQRQKAAVAELEQRQKDIEEENIQLKQILQQYQAQFGKIPGCEFNPNIVQQPSPAPTPVSLKDSHVDNLPLSTITPVLTASTPSTSVYQQSPVLAPTLSLSESNMFESSTTLSVSTGGIGFEDPLHATTQHSIPDNFDFDPLSDDLAGIFDQNALANVPYLPDLNGNFVDSFNYGVVESNPGQLQTDSYFDFDAYDTNSAGGVSFETPQQTSRLQSQFSASS